jgi:hypothetical protein
MNKNTQLPVYYDDVKGWIVLTDETLNNSMLLSLRDYVYKVNLQRSKGMAGDKRKRVECALIRLQKEGITQMATKQSLAMFQSTEKTTNKSYHQLGGL